MLPLAMIVSYLWPPSIPTLYFVILVHVFQKFFRRKFRICSSSSPCWALARPFVACTFKYPNDSIKWPVRSRTFLDMCQQHPVFPIYFIILTSEHFVCVLPTFHVYKIIGTVIVQCNLIFSVLENKWDNNRPWTVYEAFPKRILLIIISYFITICYIMWCHRQLETFG